MKFFTLLLKNYSMNIWYQTLTKPPLTPPVHYFSTAWEILYTFMAASLIIVLSKPVSKTKYIAINLFAIQLIFNFLWGYIFFELKSIDHALIDLILLLIFLIFTVIYFFKISKFAGWLLIPYLFQVIFALYLNTGLLILNQNQ